MEMARIFRLLDWEWGCICVCPRWKRVDGAAGEIKGNGLINMVTWSFSGGLWVSHTLVRCSNFAISDYIVPGFPTKFPSLLNFHLTYIFTARLIILLFNHHTVFYFKIKLYNRFNMPLQLRNKILLIFITLW